MKRYILFFILSALSQITHSLELYGIEVHGSLSQGFVYTTDNDVYGSSTDGSFDFTELNLNLSKDFESIPNLRAVLQVSFRHAGRSDALDLPRADRF